MNRFRLFILILSLAATAGLKADFYAYQEWENRETGTTVHEFFDVHLTRVGRVNLVQQQNDFIAFAKQYNGLALIEDSAERVKEQSGNYPMLHTEETSDKYKLDGVVFFDGSPMAKLIHTCQQQSIACINIDQRDYTQMNPNALHGAHELDRYTIECIQNSPHKHIFVAAGGRHLASINIQLSRKGFRLKKTVLDHNLQAIYDIPCYPMYQEVKKYLDIILTSYCTGTDPYSFAYGIDIFIATKTDLLVNFYPINIRSIMATYSTEKSEQAKQMRLIATTSSFLKKTATAASLLSTAYLLYTNKPKAAGLAGLLGMGLCAASNSIAQWWYS